MAKGWKWPGKLEVGGQRSEVREELTNGEILMTNDREREPRRGTKMHEELDLFCRALGFKTVLLVSS